MKIENQFNNLTNRTGNGTEFNENSEIKVRNLNVVAFLSLSSILSGNSGPYNTDITRLLSPRYDFKSAALLKSNQGDSSLLISILYGPMLPEYRP